MARIKQSSKTYGHMVVEDPRPNSTTIFIQDEAHDFSSLSPIFAKSLISRTSGTPTSQLGSVHCGTNTVGAANNPFRSLVLSKGSTSVSYSTDSLYGSRYVNLDTSWGQAIDPQYQPTGSFYIDYNNVKSVFINNCSLDKFESQFSFYASVNGELYDTIPTTERALANETGSNDIYYWHPYYIYPLMINGKIATNGRYSRGSNYNGYTQQEWLVMEFDPGYVSQYPILTSITRSTLELNQWWDQMLGISVDNKVLYFVNNSGNDNQQKVVKYDMDTNTTSYLYEWSTVRAAYSGSVGGTRTLSPGINRQRKLASQFFDDPNAANTKGFYVPYFDTNNNFQPYYYQWETTTDTFTRNEDVKVVTETVTDTAFNSSTYLNGLTGSLTGDGYETNQLCAVVFNETFTVTNSGTTTRYLVMGALNGIHQTHDGVDSKRGVITFEIDSADPTVLIYHSHFVTPETAKNIVWLNDDKTLLGIFYYNSFRIYSFTSDLGWTESQVISERFVSVGRDRSDRIWAIAQSQNSNYGDLHLITPTLPVTIRVVPETETYNYQGTTISTYLNVDAINVQGNRIATDVTLVIDGSTIKFSDDTTSKVVTTSDSGAVQVNVKVVDSGFSQIIASVTV